ncbi:DUF7130 family rubredoxin-like protein [Halogeometricum limi]|uniref:DUF7130 domain-containing protein n=1 Tax=Halogeometricum limi TaxID=555875 RepID=A0A1I6FX82_9EURY|nr:hypothetical protein [Halogeometricum limi]SFR34543.1 hypothetical protein SAMN04488124_0476 [Halogeometricum limi]
MSDDSETTVDTTPIEAGTVVYDGDGTALGVVDGFTDVGFEVDIDAGVDEVDRSQREGEQREQVPGQEFGEGYLQWRCDDCGAVGDLEDGLSTTCPDCGSDAVYRKRED